ncbi:unnamed protein product [Enterobius vermicularis]|uniref:Interfer-bind domain-containing protein n=1 Tax=Enterobius vermicularis TaxID=51028 RepID=A0A0N4UUK3_ENTVE|nr:unnamed protein product [Enterobius vermicularis]
MNLLCSPSCAVTLTSVGSAQISTAFDMCKSPPNLEIKITTPVRDEAVTSTFTAKNTLETRQIGSGNYPLELKVKFREQTLWNNRKSYRAEAYVRMPETGEMSYFMNGSIEVPPNGYCKYHHSSSSVQILLLCTLLTLFFVGTSIAVSMLIHCIYARQLNIKSRSHKSKTVESDSVQVLPSYPHTKLSRVGFDDDRLPVILEIEEDELDKISETVPENEPLRRSFRMQLTDSIPQLAVSRASEEDGSPTTSTTAATAAVATTTTEAMNSRSVQDLTSLGRSSCIGSSNTEPTEV